MGGRREHRSLGLLRELIEVQRTGGGTEALKEKLKKCTVIVYGSKEEVRAYALLGLGKHAIVWNKIKGEEREKLIKYGRSMLVDVESDDGAI